MNGRFSKLEFGDAQEPSSDLRPDHRAAEGTPIRTAEHYAARALEAHQLGRFESALQLYTRCLREDRARIPAWVGQVQMLVELGEHAEARLWSDKALELFRNSGDLLAAKAQACLRQGDRAAAAAASDASLNAPGASPWRWAARAEVLLARHAARARDCFDRALAEPAADWFDRVAIARIYLYHGHPAAAADYARRAAELMPTHPAPWLALGRAQRRLGLADAARESLARALELRPDLEGAREALADLDADTGHAHLLRRLKGWIRR